MESADFRQCDGRAQQNCKKALTDLQPAHIGRSTDAALTVFTGSDALVANIDGQLSPEIEIGEPQLSAAFVGALFDIVSFR
jgi:hypothetical protein